MLRVLKSLRHSGLQSCTPPAPHPEGACPGLGGSRSWHHQCFRHLSSCLPLPLYLADMPCLRYGTPCAHAAAQQEHADANATGALSSHPKGGASPPPAQPHAKAHVSPASPSAKEHDHDDGEDHHHVAVPAGHHHGDEQCVCSSGDSCISTVSPLQNTVGRGDGVA